MNLQGRKKTKNDNAWEALFEKYEILKMIDLHGYFEIRASQINEFRQSRLMAKFDHESVLPEIFHRNNLSILPISRSAYYIGRFESYYKLDEHKDEKPSYKSMPFPSVIESIDFEDLFSESISLMCAYNAGIIDDVLGEVARLTIFGRMSTGDFSFHITSSSNPQIKHTINVSKSQCEIDAGFESEKFLAIVEAKNVSLSGFSIRQLYYPYRKWASIVTNKQIVPIFMTYSDELFSFYVFAFEDINDYNSISLKAVKHYKIAPEEITSSDVSQEFEKAVLIDEPNVTFPQADRFDNVLALLVFLKERPRFKDEIGDFLSVVDRQVNYYTDAAQYLGLVDESRDPDTKKRVFSLSDAGSNLLHKRHKARYLDVMRLIFSHKIFNETFQIMSDTGIIPSADVVAQIISKYNTAITGTTPRRRAQTVISWIRWIWKQIVD